MFTFGNPLIDYEFGAKVSDYCNGSVVIKKEVLESIKEGFKLNDSEFMLVLNGKLLSLKDGGKTKILFEEDDLFYKLFSLFVSEGSNNF